MFSQASAAGGEGLKYNPSGIREKAEICGMAEMSHKETFRRQPQSRQTITCL
jgi:hypothetical protein